MAWVLKAPIFDGLCARPKVSVPLDTTKSLGPPRIESVYMALRPQTAVGSVSN